MERQTDFSVSYLLNLLRHSFPTTLTAASTIKDSSNSSSHWIIFPSPFLLCRALLLPFLPHLPPTSPGTRVNKVLRGMLIRDAGEEGFSTPRAPQRWGKQVNFTAFCNIILAFNPREDFLEVKAVTRVEDFEGAPMGWGALGCSHNKRKVNYYLVWDQKNMQMIQTDLSPVVREIRASTIRAMWKSRLFNSRWPLSEDNQLNV